MGKKGDWALLTRVVLEPGERAPQVPEDTAAVPLRLWARGRLTADAEVGDEAEAVTRAGRRVKGTLLELGPCWRHGYGDHVPELLAIGDSLRALLREGGSE